ncbi:MAG: hypothetical protein GKC10_00750 [Methanosarcinales archaeon]|nr:hypothetical protein [Methanosarcinales archaeon]
MLPAAILDLAAGLIGLGLLISVVSGRLGTISLGAGSIAVGVVLISDLPEGWELVGAAFFGMIIVAGIWMISVGIKKTS